MNLLERIKTRTRVFKGLSEPAPIPDVTGVFLNVEHPSGASKATKVVVKVKWSARGTNKSERFLLLIKDLDISWATTACEIGRKEVVALCNGSWQITPISFWMPAKAVNFVLFLYIVSPNGNQELAKTAPRTISLFLGPNDPVDPTPEDPPYVDPDPVPVDPGAEQPAPADGSVPPEDEVWTPGKWFRIMKKKLKPESGERIKTETKVVTRFKPR